MLILNLILVGLYYTYYKIGYKINLLIHFNIEVIKVIDI